MRPDTERRHFCGKLSAAAGGALGTGLIKGLAVSIGASLGACSSISIHDQSRAQRHLPYRPLLFQIMPPAGYAGSGWLFGAVHAGREDLYPLPRAVMERWRQSDLLAVELDIQQRHDELKAAFAGRAFLPDGENLSRYLDATTIGRLRQRFDLDDERWNRLNQLQPWALTRVLQAHIHAAKPHGKPTPTAAQHQLGIEEIFLQQARERAITTAELELPAEQIDALTGGELQEQAALLRYRAKQAQFWDNNVNPLIQAWRNGNETRLLELKTQTYGTTDPSNSGNHAEPARTRLRQRLFDERDERMGRRLLALMHEPRTVFAVIGTYHLIGQTSVRSWLISQGATVRRHQYEKYHLA